MNKLIIKYLLEIQEDCGGSCSDRPNVSSGCGLSPIHRVRITSPSLKIELPNGGEAGEKFPEDNSRLFRSNIDAYLESLTEQNKKDEKIPDMPDEETPEVPETEEPVETPMEPTEMPEGGEAGGTDQIPTDMGMGMGAEGMPGQEEVPQDPEYIGRIYELKKIYSRLVSIESFLNDASDEKLLKLRNYVSSSIELFQTLINNITAYKDNIDNLIVFFYKFLLIVYTLLKKFYEQENDEKKQDMKEGD